FTHQYVVGAARGLRRHRLATDAGLRQWFQQAWMRDARPLAGGEQHQFGTVVAQTREDFGCERIEAADVPRLDRAVRRDEYGAMMANLVDFNEAGAVGGDRGARLRRVRVQFQFAPGFPATDRSSDRCMNTSGTL